MTVPIWPTNETTQLLPTEEVVFAKWIKQYHVKDLDAPESHYDYRGAFLAGAKPDRKGHWPDTFKQHGHESFSDESVYALPGDPEAGHWRGNKFIPNPKAPIAQAMKAILTKIGI